MQETTGGSNCKQRLFWRTGTTSKCYYTKYRTTFYISIYPSSISFSSFRHSLSSVVLLLANCIRTNICFDARILRSAWTFVHIQSCPPSSSFRMQCGRLWSLICYFACNPFRIIKRRYFNVSTHLSTRSKKHLTFITRYNSQISRK